MPGRQIVGGEPYRYAYQGQEKDPETGKEAFQLRIWDSRIGRWLTTDPYGQFHSPYMGMGNNPMNGVDIDGGLIILINGLVLPWDNPLGKYWGNYADRFSDFFKDESLLFADGNRSMTAGIRELQGAIWAVKNADYIKEQVEKTGQLIIVPHSKGGAFANGVIKQLEEMGVKTDVHVAIATYQDNVINAGNQNTIQYTNNNDFITRNVFGDPSRIRGKNVKLFEGKGGHSLFDFDWMFNHMRGFSDILNSGSRKVTLEFGEGTFEYDD